MEHDIIGQEKQESGLLTQDGSGNQCGVLMDRRSTRGNGEGEVDWRERRWKPGSCGEGLDGGRRRKKGGETARAGKERVVRGRLGWVPTQFQQAFESGRMVRASGSGQEKDRSHPVLPMQMQGSQNQFYLSKVRESRYRFRQLAQTIVHPGG